MLSGTLGRCHIIDTEHIHTLTGIDTVPVGRRQRVRQIFLIANTVAAVLGLPVNGVSGDAEDLGALGN